MTKFLNKVKSFFEINFKKMFRLFLRDLYNERGGLSRRKRVESGGRSRKLLYTYIPLSWCGGARS